jgi:hypothetical protein
MSMTIMIFGGVAILISVGLLAMMFKKANEANLTDAGDQKPDWMRSTPRMEILEATRAEGEGMTLYNADAGERVASPFAEQIEDILRVRLTADPLLSRFKVDLGTAENNELEFWVNGKKYASIDELPDEDLKKAVREAVKSWEDQK